MARLMRVRRVARFLLWVSSVSLILAIASLYPFNQATLAQRVDPDTAWQRVYEKLPDLPKENQYVSKETGKVADSNTLIGRLIRYHVYVKGRPPFFRLDWKVTLADYLGINDLMSESEYPSHSTLRQNPLAGDVAVMRQFNRAQRDALVQALTNTFDPP